MSILFPLPATLSPSAFRTTNSISIAGQAISIPVSGAVSVASTTPAENGRKFFSLKVVADLSDLQQNISGILRSQITRSPRCGERIQIQQAMLTPLAPASLVATIALRALGLSAGPGKSYGSGRWRRYFEVKLTPSVDPKSGLNLASEITRVEASGFLRDLLRTGDLGVTLREQIATALVSVLQKGAGFEATLPTAAHESASLQKAQFEDTGADQLSLILDGQVQFSDEQTKQFAAQLKQRLSAQGTSPQQLDKQ